MGARSRAREKGGGARLAPVFQTMDSAIQGINLYPRDSAIGFPDTFPLNSDLLTQLGDAVLEFLK